MQNISDQKPLIIVLDIDGTIIGDITPQILLYELHLTLKKANNKVNIMNLKKFQEKLTEGIIRPYFLKFIKRLKEHYNNVEFFIYTASERKWATFMIANIEKVLGIKFNRPLFTRDNCILNNNDYKKSFTPLRKCIVKTLKKKYSMNNSDIENRILIIDNRTDIYDKADKKHLLLCPTYNYISLENIPSFITEKDFKAYNILIYKILIKYKVIQDISNSYIDFQSKYYSKYINELEIVKTNNVKYINDKFFLYLMNILIYKNINKFTPNNVTYIAKKLQQKIA